MQRRVGEPEQIELVATQELVEQRLGVNADTGGPRYQGAKIDGDPRTVPPLAVAKLLERGDGGLSSGSGPPAAGRPGVRSAVYDSDRPDADAVAAATSGLGFATRVLKFRSSK